jgi:hypothetical protein
MSPEKSPSTLLQAYSPGPVVKSEGGAGDFLLLTWENNSDNFINNMKG